MRYIDIHSHLNDRRFTEDFDEVLARMRAAGVGSIVVGTDKKMSENAIALAERYEDIWATIGLHPTDNHREEFDAERFRVMAENPRVVAIGECGLDYYWPAHEGWKRGEESEKKRQRELFERHIEIAASVNKPMMIHCRPTKKSLDAYEDLLGILSDAKHAHGDRVRGNAHFFAGDIATAQRFFDLDFSISFTGVLTFARDYDDVVRYAPLSHMMAETDAPYVSPMPYRGARNEPVRIIEVVKMIADIRHQHENAVAKQLLYNAYRFFPLIK